MTIDELILECHRIIAEADQPIPSPAENLKVTFVMCENGRLVNPLALGKEIEKVCHDKVKAFVDAKALVRKIAMYGVQP